ncbi:MAG: magnesium transporter [Gammaproteobacteria bacterium]|nr:magnesium transporter [Gammaproteobacteria bacterium]
MQWANVLESLTQEQRLKLWVLIDSNIESTVLACMREDARHQFLESLSTQSVEQILHTATNSEVVEILNVLPSRTANKLITKLAPNVQSKLETAMSYDDEIVGRYANSDVYTINENVSVKAALDEIGQSELNSYSGSYFVLTDEQNYIGKVTINELLTADKNAKVGAISLQDTSNDHPILDSLSILDASNQIKNSQQLVLPVVTATNQFIGVFSIKDALNIFQYHYEAQVAHLGNVSDEDLFAPIFTSSRRRALWLGINLITAFIASAVIGIFDKVLVEVVALAVLMPIVASMGGIAGSQTLTLTIRGLATGQLSDVNYQSLKSKELAVAALNGVLWAAIVATVTGYWFDNYLLSMILAIALIVNMLAAAFFGILIPVILDKKGIDPALAGSVLLTTVTDVVGFFVFLGGATVIFLN